MYVQTIAVISFIFSFLFPYFVHRIAYESEKTKLYYMMQLSGMRSRSYWIGNFIYDFVLQFIWCILLIAIAYFIDVPIVKQANFSLYLALIVTWTPVLIGMAWIAAAIMPSM